MHDTEKVRMELGRRDPKKTCHFYIKERNRKPETTAGLVSEECIVPFVGLVRLGQKTWDDDGVGGTDGPKDPELLIIPRAESTRHIRKTESVWDIGPLSKLGEIERKFALMG